MTKKTRKVFFMKKAKASGRSKKLAKIKGFFKNPYVEAVGTGVLGAAAYAITSKILMGTSKTKVEEKKTTVSIYGDVGDVDVVEYAFHNYEKDIYVTAKVRQALETEELRRLKSIEDRDELLAALREHELLYLYVG